MKPNNPIGSLHLRVGSDMQPRRAAFTLIELLMVIAIIAILAAMVLAAVSRAKNSASKATDINNLRQIMIALHNYTADHDDYLTPPNWDDGGGNTPGWLYTPGAPGTNKFDVTTGLLWNDLKQPKIYFCPSDQPNALFNQRPQQISSYAMNGAVVGYMFMIDPPVKLAQMKPEDCAFWETDETDPSYFNDGANWPGEGVSGRHYQGGIHACFDASVSYIKLTDWYAAEADTNKNWLWCYPNSPDGGGPNGHNQD